MVTRRSIAQTLVMVGAIVAGVLGRPGHAAADSGSPALPAVCRNGVAVVDVRMPATSALTVDGIDAGAKRHFEFDQSNTVGATRHHLRADFGGGVVEERDVLLRSGWVVSVPITPPGAGRGNSFADEPRRARVTSGTFGADGDLLLLGCDDGTSEMWSLHSGKLLHRFSQNDAWGGPVQSTAISADCKVAVTGTFHRAVIWDVTTGARLREIVSRRPSACCALSHDGRYVATAALGEPGLDGPLSQFRDGIVNVWDATTGDLLRTFREHADAESPSRCEFVRSLVFSPDDARVLAGLDDGTAVMWDVGAGAEVRTFSEFDANRGEARSVGFSANGQRVLVAGWGFFAVFDSGDGAEVFSARGRHVGAVDQAALRPDGNAVATSTEGRTVVRRIGATGGETIINEGGAIAFAPDGRTMLCGSELIDAATGSVIRSFQGTNAIRSLSLSAVGQRMVTRADSGVVTQWNTRSGEKLRTFPTSGSPSMAMSANGRRLLTGSVGAEGTEFRASTAGVCAASLWDLQTGRLVHEFALAEAEGPVALNATGTVAVTGSPNDTATFWSLDAPAMSRTLAGHGAPVTAVAISADGRRVLTGSADKTAAIWDSHTGARIATLRGHSGPIASLALSPDGSRALTAAGTPDGTAMLWDTRTGTLIRPLAGGGAATTAVAFSDDGSQLATGTADGAAILWDAVSGERLRELRAAPAAITSVVILRDGRELLAADESGRVRLWDAAVGAEEVVICDLERPQDWFVARPDGAYDGSPTGRDFASRTLGTAHAPNRAGAGRGPSYQPGFLSKFGIGVQSRTGSSGTAPAAGGTETR